MSGSPRRELRVIVLTACLTFALAALAQPASAAPERKQYTATISPTSASVQVPTAYVVTITNATTSTTDLGSANITFPSAFTALSVGTISAPAGKAWTRTLSGNTVQLRSGGAADKLTPGQSVSVGVTARATSTGVKIIATAVKQSNNFLGVGNNFTLSGAQPTVTVGGSAALCTGGTCSAQTSNYASGPTPTNPVAGLVELETGSCSSNDCYLVIDNRNCAGSHGCVNNQIFFLPPSNATGNVTLTYLCDPSVCDVDDEGIKEDENGNFTLVGDCPEEPGSGDLPCILERGLTVEGWIRHVVLFGPGDPRYSGCC